MAQPSVAVISENYHIENPKSSCQILLMLTTLVMLGKEAFQLMHAQREYFLNWENWVQMGIILNVGLISFHCDPLPYLTPIGDRWANGTLLDPWHERHPLIHK